MSRRGRCVPCILEPELSGKRSRRTWARLIQKIYEVDPLLCPKCNGQMRVIAFVEEMGMTCDEKASSYHLSPTAMPAGNA